MKVYYSDKDCGIRYGCSVVSIWRWRKTQGFPEPVVLSPGCTRWHIDDLIAWEAARGGRAAAAEQPVPKGDAA